MKGKKLLGLALMLLLVFGSVMTAHAGSRRGTSGWKVEFDGKRLNDESFRSADIMEEASDLLPGDDITFTIDLVNKADFATDWYMMNEILKTLEEKEIIGEDGRPTAGAYTYVLSYRKGSETTTIYDNSTVGGDEASEGLGGKKDREGLYEATESLEDWMYLDTLAPNESGTLTLMIALDGETEGNAYQDTLAQLQMRFAVEENTTTTTTTTDNDSHQPEKEVIKTGDMSNIFLWSLVALGSGLVLLLLAILKRRRDRRADA